jgi:pilus assembly protein Flp/PilA
MRQFGQFVANLLRREDGPTAVEYAVMLSLIIAVCFAGISALGASTANKLAKAGTAFGAAGS